jgi:futalosine hydrolase
MLDLLVCAATEIESHLLKHHAEVLLTGVGAVNAAYSLTRFLASTTVRRIVVCGVGGAYLNSGLAIGDVCCAASETYGDLGVDSPDGFLDMEALGFPLAAGVFNTMPLQLFPHSRREKFITVNCCSGTDASARAMEKRTGGGAVESMEGAAIAHVATLASIPVGEIRGISNMTGNRDRATWRVREASTAAQEALLKWIKNL